MAAFVGLNPSVPARQPRQGCFRQKYAKAFCENLWPAHHKGQYICYGHYVYFRGIWGCDVELRFWGDVEYSVESRNPELEDPYWDDSTLLIQDGFIYLLDDGDRTVDDIGVGFCYFMARHMK